MAWTFWPLLTRLDTSPQMLPKRSRHLWSTACLITADLILNAAKSATGEHPRAEAAIRLEQLWKEIAKSYDVDVLCGYSLGSFQGRIGSHIFHKLCAAHSAIDSR